MKEQELKKMTIEDYKKEFEKMTYEELHEITKIIMPLKREKYNRSETAKNRKAKCRSKEKQNNSSKKYYAKNREKILAKRRKKRNENKDKENEKSREYYKRNREKCIEKYKRYYYKNREKLLAKQYILRRKKENEKTITLSNKVATKHADTRCLFDVSQLWNTYEHDYS